MSSIADAAWLADLHRAPRTVVVVDMVESVRLIERYEEPTIRRWRSFVQTSVQEDVLPRGGRLVKSLGDGMMLEFTEPLPAVQCALALQARLAALNEPLLADERMDARIGIHAADVIVQEEDIYGAGVNLAARVATLAGPGEIVVTPAVRDQVVDGLDAQTEDLGECYLKHLPETIRAYRVGTVGAEPVVAPSSAVNQNELKPTIAVIPLAAHRCEPGEVALGEIVADGLIATLSKTDRWHVVSRLSVSPLRNRGLPIEKIERTLKAKYVLSGSYSVGNGRMSAFFELSFAPEQRVIWADTMTFPSDELFAASASVLQEVVAKVSGAVLADELNKAATLPMPALEGYSILLHGINMMHRTSVRESDRAQQALDYLIERYPRLPEPRAWIGKWHVLRMAQAWTGDPAKEAQYARAALQRSLDLNPNHALSLAVDGHICAFMLKDLETASERISQAIAANPNESLAWLFKSSLHAYRGEGAQAVEAAYEAERLSPLDPVRYFYDGFVSFAALVAGDYKTAVERCQRSMRCNKTHVPTYLTLAISYELAGSNSRAHDVVQDLLRLRPSLRASGFLNSFPGGEQEHSRNFANALRSAGLPF